MSLLKNDNYLENIKESIESYGQLEVLNVDLHNSTAKVKNITNQCLNLDGLCDQEVCNCDNEKIINYDEYLNLSNYVQQTINKTSK